MCDIDSYRGLGRRAVASTMVMTVRTLVVAFLPHAECAKAIDRISITVFDSLVVTPL
jgi:hypothetical protein